MSGHTTLQDVLKLHGYHLTSARQYIFNTLKSSGPCTITEIHHAIGSNVHRASIYRAIQLFEEIGVARRIQIGWKYKIELSDIFNDHHHHAHCISCQSIISLPLNEQLERLIFSDAEAQHFSVTEHSLELYGYCKQCGTKKTPDE